MNPHAMILTASANLKGKARKYSAGYLKIALVIVDLDALESMGIQRPKMISDRARGVIKVVSVGSYYWGLGKKSEGARVRAGLESQAWEFNNGLRHF